MPAPASSALAFDISMVDIDPSTFSHDNPYVGDPRPELDKAWDALTNSKYAVSSSVKLPVLLACN
jgi:hypothetical protein